MCAMLASTALRSRRKILAVQSVNHALSMAACSLLRGWSGAVQEAVNLVRDLAILLFGQIELLLAEIFFVAAALGLGAAVTFAEAFSGTACFPFWPRPSIRANHRPPAVLSSSATAAARAVYNLPRLGLRRPFPLLRAKAGENNHHESSCPAGVRRGCPSYHHGIYQTGELLKRWQTPSRPAAWRKTSSRTARCSSTASRAPCAAKSPSRRRRPGLTA